MKTIIEWVVGYLIRHFGGLERLNLKISSKFPNSTTFILNSSKTKFVGNYLNNLNNLNNLAS